MNSMFTSHQMARISCTQVTMARAFRTSALALPHNDASERVLPSAEDIATESVSEAAGTTVVDTVMLGERGDGGDDGHCARGVALVCVLAGVQIGSLCTQTGSWSRSSSLTGSARSKTGF